MADGTYSIEDLERILGLRGRTIRYWSHEGLFEGPGAGRGTRYTDEHLARLFLIQKLRAEGRPIGEIRAAIRRLSAAELQALVEEARRQPPRRTMPARQLIRQWLQERDERREDATPAAWSMGGTAQQSWSWRAPVPKGHWQRVPLAPGVELHVQHPLSPSSEALVDDLIALARRLSKEDRR